MEWIKCIEALPIDGQWVLSFSGNNAVIGEPRGWQQCVVIYQDGAFQMGCDKQPNHWMPLPEPPK